LCFIEPPQAQTLSALFLYELHKYRVCRTAFVAVGCSWNSCQLEFLRPMLLICIGEMKTKEKAALIAQLELLMMNGMPLEIC
jgi:hypothetical protein